MTDGYHTGRAIANTSQTSRSFASRTWSISSRRVCWMVILPQVLMAVETRANLAVSAINKGCSLGVSADVRIPATFARDGAGLYLGVHRLDELDGAESISTLPILRRLETCAVSGPTSACAGRLLDRGIRCSTARFRATERRSPRGPTRSASCLRARSRTFPPASPSSPLGRTSHPCRS